MANEIERKFLVHDGWREVSHRQTRIVQGYLSSGRGGACACESPAIRDS